MSQAQQRGIILLQQGRYDLADTEFRRSLAEEPDDPLSHAYLSICLSNLNRGDEALREAGEAVRLGPELAFSHYVRGNALRGMNRLADAENAANEAIQLDPEDADYRALRGSIAVQRKNWKEALEAAGEGLELDPEHTTCLNIRAMALVQLGFKDEAAATLGEALAEDPDNPFTHANQGWALLHKGDHKQALEHFREALRIDPNMEWAQVGIVEALKAKHLIYRWMLSFFLWMGRQSSAAQWGIILGFVFGRRFLANLAKNNPAFAPWITPILIVSFGFLIMTWIASPLFNFILRFNTFGRLVLSREQRVESSWIGGCFLVALGSFLLSFVPGAGWAILPTMYFGFLLFPMAVTFRQEPGKPRWLAIAYTSAVALAGGLGMISLFEPAVLWNGMTSESLLQYFYLGSILSTWLGAFLGRNS